MALVEFGWYFSIFFSATTSSEWSISAFESTLASRIAKLGWICTPASCTVGADASPCCSGSYIVSFVCIEYFIIHVNKSR